MFFVSCIAVNSDTRDSLVEINFYLFLSVIYLCSNNKILFIQNKKNKQKINLKTIIYYHNHLLQDDR